MRIDLLAHDQPAAIARNLQTVPFLARRSAGCKAHRVGASMRIPVTPANRALLRELRAAELAVWNKTSRSGQPVAAEKTEETL